MEIRGCSFSMISTILSMDVFKVNVIFPSNRFFVSKRKYIRSFRYIKSGISSTVFASSNGFSLLFSNKTISISFFLSILFLADNSFIAMFQRQNYGKNAIEIVRLCLALSLSHFQFGIS